MQSEKTLIMNPEILDACRHLETDFRSALSSPIWQSLYLENPAFAQELPSEFKIQLLKAIFLKWNQLSVPDEEFPGDGGEEDRHYFELNCLLERLSEIEVDVDPWETEWPGVRYTNEDTELERSFKIGDGWTVDIRFSDCDIEMKDVNYGCDERLCLRQWLEAFFENPNTDIRTFAEACDINYEPAMSPEEGFYFRFWGFLFTHTSGAYFELEAHEIEKIIESDQKLAQRLEASTGILESEDLLTLRTSNSELRPIIDAPPTVDEETHQESDAYEWYSHTGWISLFWKFNCWLPSTSKGGQSIGAGGKDQLAVFSKHPVDIEFDAHGNSPDFYQICFSRQYVDDAKDEILKLLDDDRLQPLYLYALGLPFTQPDQK